MKIKCEEGELICDKCEGRGSIPSIQNPQTMASTCSKCLGAGKVDWVENILGKKPPPMSATSSSWANSTSGHGIPQSFLDEASKKLADEIDMEIMGCIIKEAEQSKNKMKAAATVLSKIGGPAIDNGIISKLMFFFTSKSQIKSKENRCAISRYS